MGLSAGNSSGLRLGRYLAGTAIAVGAVLSQYIVPTVWPASYGVYHSLAADLAIVYALPIAAFALLVGWEPLRRWKDNLGVATVQGLGWYGGLSLLGIAVAIVLVIVYLAVDPGALGLLNRENPALKSAEANPWLFVGLSFLIGACEETIFRGWIFGGWLRGSDRWFAPAVVTSVLFAGVHVYYFQTYGPASPFSYVQLFLLGFAFAATYHGSGGNLLIPALLHGLNDAIAFVAVLSPTAELAAHYLFIVGAAVVGLVYLLKGSSAAPVAVPPPVG